MLPALGLVVLGLAFLTGGAEALVRGASRLAAALGVSRLVIGLTLVAYGTSTPELVVSTVAALRELPGVAIGNVVGSNSFNTGVVLGIAALLRPLSCHVSLVRREVPLVILITAGLALLVWDGALARLECGVLLLGAVAYTAWAYREGRRSAARDAPSPRPADPRGPALAAWLLLALAGLVLLVLGARWLVSGAIELADRLGVSETVIGVTIVAGGTSLPELATSVVAAIRREPDIAIGNVLGSNIFNILAILGLAGLIHPLAVPLHILRLDLPVALAFAVACLPIVLRRRRISRRSAALLLLGYAAYSILLFARATPI